MNRRRLGGTSLEVSPLCFGTLTLGPLQKNFSTETAVNLLMESAALGINFFDTAEIYDTYRFLRAILQKYPALIIASRSYAVTYAEMEQSLDRARQALNRDYIDIFSLHEVENHTSLQGHRGALECLFEAREKGIIKAVGISTHTIAGVRAGATEPGVEIIHPLINKVGIGIKDGSTAGMIDALRTAKEFGKGIYAMKVLAGGHLAVNPQSAVNFVTGLGCIDSLAIGMQSIQEVRVNLSLINGESPPPDLTEQLQRIKRRLQVATWCQKCGKCAAKCSFGALTLVNGVLKVEPEKCVRCGYCVRVCPEFCLRIV